MDGTGRDRRPSSSPRNSPFSPFPFGTPITRSDRSILSPGHQESLSSATSLALESQNAATSSQTNVQHVIRGRIRAQDVYGGPLTFGGSSSLRRNRLLSASPYQGIASNRYTNRHAANRSGMEPKLSNAPTPSSSKSTTPTSEDGMSSTARLILDTLERMSTPIRDAQKIPIVGRAEKRRQVMSELESSLVSSSSHASPSNSKRRRPNLGGQATSLSNHRTLLNGPPLRTLMSPTTATSASPRSRLNAVKSARLSTVTSPMSSATSIPATSTPFSNAGSFASRTSDAFKPSEFKSRQEASSNESGSSKYTIPFSVPALTGGLASSSVKKEQAKPSFSVSPSFMTDAKKNNLTGKVRTKLGDKAVDLEGQEAAALPAHLQNPISSGLNMKQLPSFGLDFLQGSNKIGDGKGVSTSGSLVNSSSSSSGGALSKCSSKTADTVLLSPIRRTTSISSFTFSEPVLVKKMVPDSYKMANGDSKKSSQQFSFSQPVQVVGSCQVTTNQLPDLTSSMVSGPIKARVSKEVQPLKFGSVMDILGGSSKLPDVTASTGIKVSSGSTWDSKFKMGQTQNDWS